MEADVLTEKTLRVLDNLAVVRGAPRILAVLVRVRSHAEAFAVSITIVLAHDVRIHDVDSAQPRFLLDSISANALALPLWHDFVEYALLLLRVAVAFFDDC